MHDARALIDVFSIVTGMVTALLVAAPYIYAAL
jgi:hypothetical protein